MPELGHLEAAHDDRDGDKPRFEDPGVGSQVHGELQRIPRPPAPPAARRPWPRPCTSRPIIVRSGPWAPPPAPLPPRRDRMAKRSTARVGRSRTFADCSRPSDACVGTRGYSRNFVCWHLVSKGRSAAPSRGRREGRNELAAFQGRELGPGESSHWSKSH